MTDYYIDFRKLPKKTPKEINQMKKELPQKIEYVKSKIQDIQEGKLDKKYLPFYKRVLEGMEYRLKYDKWDDITKK